ncbi:MAG TPA: gamma-glutamyltransferase, partial [Polyangiaceae bacterium]
MRERVLRGILRWLPIAAVVALLVLLAPEGRAEKATPRAAAATEHPLATRAALDLIGKGGNAVDAVAAAALVAGVVNPVSSGIGGGGFALVYRPGDAQPFVLDFRESAPLSLDPAAFEKATGPEARGQLVGVPGEVAGLYELARRFGKLPWADIVAPAERFARLGFATGAHLARALGEPSAAQLGRDPSLKSLYFPRGKPLLQGHWVRNERLARTLRRISAEGPSAFYDGAIAAELAATARSAGGTLSVEDLRNYTVKERAPLRGEWAGHTIFTMPPPSAGGLLLLQTAGMLSAEELRQLGWNSGAYQHLIAEAFRASLADRLRHAGDPHHVRVDVARLLDAKRLAERRRALALDRTHTTGLFVTREAGTHHLSVTDGSGMTVALTTTVNRSFGAKLVAPDSGVVLNDQLADFTLPSDTAGFGIAASPNAPRPGARPVSSMTPTLAVRDGRAVLAIGGSGGPTIPTNVT